MRACGNMKTFLGRTILFSVLSSRIQKNLSLHLFLAKPLHATPPQLRLQLSSCKQHESQVQFPGQRSHSCKLYSSSLLLSPVREMADLHRRRAQTFLILHSHIFAHPPLSHRTLHTVSFSVHPYIVESCKPERDQSTGL